MRRITSVLTARALAFALAVPAVNAGASAPRPDDIHAWSWLQQVASTIWAVVAGSDGSHPGPAAAAPTDPDTAPHMDPDGFASPDPGSAAAATTDPDTAPDMDPNG